MTDQQCGHPALFRDPDTGECAGCWGLARQVPRPPTLDVRAARSFELDYRPTYDGITVNLRCCSCGATAELLDGVSLYDLACLARDHELRHADRAAVTPAWPPPAEGEPRWSCVHLQQVFVVARRTSAAAATIGGTDEHHWEVGSESDGREVLASLPAGWTGTITYGPRRTVNLTTPEADW